MVRLSLEALEDRSLPSVTFSQYPIPTSSSGPLGITTGPDGNIWLTESKSNRIGTVNVATGTVTEYSVPTASSAPFGIAAGPDGNVWFTENSGNKIGEFNPATGAISEFAIPTASSSPLMIAAAPDGYLWFTESAANQLGVIDPSTDAITEIALPTSGSVPVGIVAGADGNIWFTENAAGRIGDLNVTTGAVTEFPTPTSSSGPLGIVAGPDGNLWFTENNTSQIGSINLTTHAINEYPLASTVEPVWMATGADGNIWFTETNTAQLENINPATQAITTVNAPGAGSSPMIAPGPNGTLWLTEAGSNQIGMVGLAPGISANPANQHIDAGQNATFTAYPAGTMTTSVQWYVSVNGTPYSPLTDGGIYSGTDTDSLTITGAPLSFNGNKYQAVFSNASYPGAKASSQGATLTVRADLSIPATLPQGTVGASYNQSLTIGGGVRPFTNFTVTTFDAGTTGLTETGIVLHPGAGTIAVSGTPTGPGTATFTVNVTDWTGVSLSQTVTLGVNTMPAIASLTASQWTAGKSGFNGTMTIAGGTAPFTIAGTSGLPTGMTAHINNTTISFSGVPTVARTFSGSVTIRDRAGALATQTFSITIAPALSLSEITITQWTAGVSGFAGTMTVHGGTGAVGITHVSGLPAGLNAVLNGNIVSFTGIPTTARDYTAASITLQDSVGAGFTRLFQITINSPATVSALNRTQWTEGQPGFAGSMNIRGGTGPLIVTAVNGLPNGLGVALTGRTINISGTPGLAQAFAGSVTIQDAAGVSVTQSFNITINSPAQIGAITASQWTAGKAGFDGTMTITGGTGPFGVVGATGLPTGLTARIMGTTIAFIGVPTAARTFAGTITIRDAVGARITQNFSITINPALSLTAPTRTQWTVGAPNFSGVMAFHGGTGAVSILHVSGLPAGLSAVLNGNTISFTGTPTTAKTFAASITLEDNVGASVTRQFQFTINPSMTVTALTTTKWTQGKAGFTGTMNVHGGTGPFTITAVDGLPDGLNITLRGRTLRITGRPGAAGVFGVSVTLEDAAGTSVTQNFSVTIRSS